MPEPQELIQRREENFALGRLQPQSVRELFFFAEKVAASKMFPGVDTPEKAFLMMSQGVELGLSPLQSVRELNIINGRVDVPASVRAARIQASPKTTRWEVDSNDAHCSILAERSDRKGEYQVNINLEDMSLADKNKHKDHLADWLYARAVRRASRQFFADLNLAIGTDEEMRDPDRVINVAAVEKEVGGEAVGTCEQCGEPTYLHPSKNGGVYSECRNGHRQSPPQKVRDAVRGRGEEFQPNIDDEADPYHSPPLLDGRDPTEEESATLRHEWTQEILKRLKENMRDDAPHDLHGVMISNWGGLGGLKVADWLDAMTLEDLSGFHDEIMSVEV